MIKVLNLYAGIGGNRKLWEGVEVTAVENNPEIAEIYKEFFPNDTVIVGDAKDYLLEHFQEFDFIWASPPCPTHSRMRNLWSGSGKDIKGKVAGSSFKLPDMDLYSIIIFLKHFFKGNWVVENVISYYEPLIKPQVLDNHYFWCNFILENTVKKTRGILIDRKQEQFGFDLTNYDLPKRFKRTLLNNLVRPKVGLVVFNSSYKTKQEVLT